MRKLYPVSVSCGVLEVSASGYFNWLRRREDGHGRSGPGRRHSDEAVLVHIRAIRAIHAEVKGEYGWPRMHKELLARSIRVSEDRVKNYAKQGQGQLWSALAMRTCALERFRTAWPTDMAGRALHAASLPPTV